MSAWRRKQNLKQELMIHQHLTLIQYKGANDFSTGAGREIVLDTRRTRCLVN
jgi:hypothetical protein